MSTATTRETLIARLSEAAEVEHNLMCVYLYAGFSLKGAEEGLSPRQVETVARWRREIFTVAREEMVHLLLVSNLLTAIGAAPHFGRANFPQPPGMMPADMNVRLAPFDRETLQHFVWLERPEEADEAMGDGFSPVQSYRRGAADLGGRLMPHAVDYPTVGALYRQIEADLTALAAQLGEEGLFIGGGGGQIGAALVNLPGVATVRCLASALSAVEAIVVQGEGSRGGEGPSHYDRFLGIRAEYDALLADDPAFAPGRPAAHNPVMRRPPTPEGKVFIEAPEAARVVDLGNAIYSHMLRLLLQAFGPVRPAAETAALVDAAIGLMFALTPVAEHATTLRARDDNTNCNAGLSFAMLRAMAVLPQGASEWRMLAGRLDEIEAGASRIAGSSARLQAAAAMLAEMAAGFREAVKGFPVGRTPDAPAALAPPAPKAQLFEGPGIERADGAALSILFEAKRCIHARFCVTGLPQVFKANVEGAWIDPDAASTEALVGVAHACPSGAIRYLRHDGGPEEAPPEVNILRIRENGPLAIHAEIMLGENSAMTRATLCRCGKSRNKPFCDNSHIEAGFAATGEPASRTSEPLAVRGGPLQIAPQKDGPLAVKGPLEICCGTGRTVDRVMAARLCRCGGSANKPYCDGTHAQIGFRSD